MNRQILRGVCAVLPGTAMAAAHWFPWRRLFGRQLHRLEAYGIGTAAIVGTAAAAMRNSDGDGKEHAGLLVTAAASAGVATVIAWAVDAFIEVRSEAYARHTFEEVARGLRPESS